MNLYESFDMFCHISMVVSRVHFCFSIRRLYSNTAGPSAEGVLWLCSEGWFGLGPQLAILQRSSKLIMLMTSRPVFFCLDVGRRFPSWQLKCHLGDQHLTWCQSLQELIHEVDAPLKEVPEGWKSNFTMDVEWIKMVITCHTMTQTFCFSRTETVAKIHPNRSPRLQSL